MKYGKTIGKVIYCYVLPTLGTSFLIISMFHRNIDGMAVSPESDTLLAVAALILCASTWFAAFQYWNAFLREYTIVHEELHLDNFEGDMEDVDEYPEYYPEPEYLVSQRVELDSPVKGLCLPFVCEYTEDWQKQRGGWGNGYVLISSDHPASGLEYDDEQVPYFEEELTFAGTFSTDMLESCGISKDIAKDADKYWVFGFDTLHVWNNPYKNNEDWVRSKTVQLAAEFIKLYTGEVV